MAERIVSPGVFTQEIDQSFLPSGITEIGAAIIGFTKKGPAFVPTKISNFSEYREVFGGYDTNMFVPYAAASYLKNGSPLTVCRVLGLDTDSDSGYGNGIREVLLIGAEEFGKEGGLIGSTTRGTSVADVKVSSSLILAEVYESAGASDVTSTGLVSAGAGYKGFYADTTISTNLTMSFLHCQF